MVREVGPPAWLWRGVLIALVGALAGGSLLLSALSVGWNNPRPGGPPDWRMVDGVSLDVAPPDTSAARLVGMADRAFTLEGVGIPLSGMDSDAYGLIFRAQSVERYAVFAVGCDGYLAVLQVEGGTESALLDWQQFPHIRRGRAANRLRLSCGEGVCSFWVNDEYVGRVPDEMGRGGEVGIWARRSGGDEVRVAFDQLAVWSNLP